MIDRKLKNRLAEKLEDNKIIVVLGPRQVGKTTLLKTVTKDKEAVLWWNGDETDVREMLAKPTSTYLKRLIGNNKILVIDEAQRIENIGLCLKLIHDNISHVKVIATGSSAFDLANRVNEPLTGRKWEYKLYPIAYSELVDENGLMETNRLLEHLMVFGFYPEVLNNPGKEQEVLHQLADSYLYKDILAWERIQKPDKLEKLVQAIAFQVGNLVSYNELGQMAGLNNETVEHYINLLEKAFIIFRLGTYSRNLRNELKKSRKIYFYDNGIRNAVIKQFNPLALRNDKGALWENFIIAERMKFCAYNKIYQNTYFWRNHAQNEVDYVEERSGSLFAYEFKWSKNQNKLFKFPKAFINAYSPEESKVINRENFIDFIS